MDEATRLVQELHSKLARLDQQVCTYRVAMTTEFSRYQEDLLKNVTPSISNSVRAQIAADMKSFASLQPPTSSADCVESCLQPSSPGSRQLEKGQEGTETAAQPFLSNDQSTNNSPPRLLPRSISGTESPRSPHDRDLEFHGLFTPSYLPLLDSRTDRRPSEQLSPHDVRDAMKETDVRSGSVDVGTNPRSAVASPELQRPATPRRKNTDEWSVTSDHSDGPVRRSALRRSSSHTASSPRRVRFEVAGAEVLPTASPLPRPSVLTEEAQLEDVSLGADSDEEGGSEQIEDVDAPPPKRISSSQALRALSRSPYENDGTQWTTVSAPVDESASTVTSGPDANASDDSDDSDDSLEMGSARLKKPTEPMTIPDMSRPLTISPKLPPSLQSAETASDDDLAEMAPLKRSPKIGPSLSTPIVPTNGAEKSPRQPYLDLEGIMPKSGVPGEQLSFDDEQNELFFFDENPEAQRSPPELEDEEEEDSEPPSPEPLHDEKSALKTSSYSRSPARSITPRFPTKPSPTTTTSSFPKPASLSKPSPISKGVVGSYKGHPFNMPIVSDEMHAQAASLGPMTSFVGSVHGRSGVDESDIQSFKESFRSPGATMAGVGFEGTPRSMSERMMMEDIQEQRRAQQGGK